MYISAYKTKQHNCDELILINFKIKLILFRGFLNLEIDCESWKNCRTDRDAVWAADSCVSNEPCFRPLSTWAPPGEYDWTIHARRRCGCRCQDHYCSNILSLFVDRVKCLKWVGSHRVRDSACSRFRFCCTPFWGLSPQKKFFGVNGFFPAKLAKYWNFHIIETIASIATKFCTVIWEAIKYSLWVVQIRLKQIQDGEKPPSWTIEEEIAISPQWIDWFWCKLVWWCRLDPVSQ